MMVAVPLDRRRIRCEIPFYNNIEHASENAMIGFILMNLSRRQHGTKIYIRESYTSIISSIMHADTSSIHVREHRVSAIRCS